MTRSLAALGAAPAFPESLHVGRPNVGDRARFLSRLNDLLDRKWLTNAGRYVEEFERRLADMMGVRHCVAMCNGTIALEIATRALGMKDEVILPSFTFVATAHALQWQAITPVFADIDPHTHNLDPAAVERMITPRTTGIVGVHLWGRPCAVEALEDIARRRGLTLLFDAAHALGCSHGGRPVGGFGHAEVFSFHATKCFNTFEGGAVATNDDDLAKKMRLMKNFGFAGYDNVIYVGTNGKMSEVAAAMGLTNLESLADFAAVNRANYQSYRACLADVPGVHLIEHSDAEQANHQYVVAEVEETQAGLSRDQLLQVLQAENVIARRYFYPGCHRMEPYRSYFPHAGLLLPVTERVAGRVLVLPTGTAVGPREIALICDILRAAIDQRDAVSAAVPRELPIGSKGRAR